MQKMTHQTITLQSIHLQQQNLSTKQDKIDAKIDALTALVTRIAQRFDVMDSFQFKQISSPEMFEAVNNHITSNEMYSIDLVSFKF